MSSRKKQVIHQFIKYAVVGGSGLILDIGLLVIFKEWVGLSATMAVLVSQIIVLGYNFTLNKYWSFAENSLPHKQIVRYGILAGWNYLFSGGTMYFFHEVLGANYLMVRLGAIACMVLWNFILYKKWVYKS